MKKNSEKKDFAAMNHKSYKKITLNLPSVFTADFFCVCLVRYFSKMYNCFF